MTGRRRGASVATAILVLALAGAGACSGDDEGEDERGSTTTATPEDDTGACALLTTEEVGELFGTGAETATPPGAAGTTCLWQSPTEAGSTPSDQLQLSVYTGGAPLDPSSFGRGAQPVEGLGDEAFVIPQGNLGTVAGVQDGDRGIVVVYATLGDPAERAARSDAVIGLLRTAAGRAGD